MKPRWVLLALGTAVVVIGAGLVRVHIRVNTSSLRSMVRPGRLSLAHAFLANRCSACHTPGKGVEAVNCVACHANNQNLLQRQPTAFHADVGRCAECHAEHRGATVRPVVMDHAVLAKIGLQLLSSQAPDSEGRLVASALRAWIERARAQLGSTASLEAILNCASCHANQDRHSGLFGADCSECHTTKQWTIAGYRHPSPRSLDCAQCHQAPPSHYMEHFEMVSKRVAGIEHAQVSQCYLCHQTTSWNDIRGIGWYKHH